MRRIVLSLLVLVLPLLAACSTTGGAVNPPGPSTESQESAEIEAARSVTRTAVLLAINDVYRIEGVENGTAGGLARVRTLRAQLEREYPDLLVLHGGDFLFPSFASRMYQGEQMIAVLDDLDGEPVAFDERMFAVIGNHELEQKKKEDAALLDARVQESQFHWLDGNVIFSRGENGAALVGAPNLTRTALIDSGNIRIGLFGITLPVAQVGYVERFDDPIATARKLTADLREQGAEVVVALTHQNAVDDRRLLETLGADGPDLIVGGHDHERMAFQAAGRWVLKADADARTATVIHLTLPPHGKLAVSYEHRPLDSTVMPDPEVQSLVDQWQTKHEQAFCAQAGDAPDCLETVYGHARTELEAEETKIRRRETSLGDWVTDRMRETFASCGAQVAFLNSGTLRLNQDLAAGSEVRRRHTEELIGYPTPLHLIRIDGATLQKVVDHALQGWPGAGNWLQISGFAWAHDTTTNKASRLTLLGPDGPRAVRPDETILAVTNDYLATGQDGYTMLSPGQVVADCPQDNAELKTLLVSGLQAAEPQGIAPQVEGRICETGTGKTTPAEACLAAP
jgi:2',3'-cyclic-nucleotide 2'-phosphodiesterase (5'-nucleotidase family)